VVSAHSPTGTNVSAQSPVIGVTFSVPMNKATALAAFSILPNVAGNFTWAGNQLLYTLKYAFAPNQSYTVTVAKTATSVAGLTLAAQFSWSFRSGNVPAITFYTPTGSGVALSTNKMIRIVFNQPMDKASTEAAFTLVPAVAGGLSWIPSNNELRYTFATKCAPLTSYTVTLAATAKSAGAVALAAPFSWNFKTGTAGKGLKTSASLTAASAPTAAGAEIMVDLTAAAEVTVTIRNVAGREIAILQPGQLAAGMNTLLWDGKSATGTKVPSGTYLIEVKANTADGSSRSAVSSLQR
jgi:hypothetical protein